MFLYNSHIHAGLYVASSAYGHCLVIAGKVNTLFSKPENTLCGISSLPTRRCLKKPTLDLQIFKFPVILVIQANIMKYIASLAFSLVFYHAVQAQAPTIREIFDFDPGDVFHIEIPGSPVKGERYRILEKQFSDSGNTVTYTVYDFGYTSDVKHNPYRVIYHHRSDTVQWIYTNLDSSIFHLKEIDAFLEKHKYVYADYRKWSTNQHDSSVTAVIDSSSGVYPALCGEKAFSMIIYHSWQNAVSIVWWKARKYSKGMGLINQYDGRIADGHGKYLIYYKKGKVECGRKDTVGISAIEESFSPLFAFELYPNPASEYVQILFPESETTIVSQPAVVRLYNNTGQLVLTRSGLQQTQGLDISHLPKGIYQLELTIGNMKGRKLLVKN